MIQKCYRAIIFVFPKFIFVLHSSLLLNISKNAKWTLFNAIASIFSAWSCITSHVCCWFEFNGWSFSIKIQQQCRFAQTPAEVPNAIGRDWHMIPNSLFKWFGQNEHNDRLPLHEHHMLFWRELFDVCERIWQWGFNLAVQFSTFFLRLHPKITSFSCSSWWTSFNLTVILFWWNLKYISGTEAEVWLF